MRYIDKTNRCIAFDDFVTKNRGRLRNEWAKFKKVDNDGSVRLSLHQHLWRGQKGLCCYCEQNIPERTKPEEEPKSQFEHIRPKKANKARFAYLTYEFNNITISCEGFDLTDFLVDNKSKREFCGHIKDDPRRGNVYNDSLFLNPTEIRDIESYFRFDSEGNIEPHPSKTIDEQSRAAYMIRLLDLDHPTLISMRQEQYSTWYERSATISFEDLVAELDETLPLLPSFFSLLKQTFL